MSRLTFVPTGGLTGALRKPSSILPVRRSSRHSALVYCCAPMYLDDEFGGFKGVRKSEESESWGKSGERVEVHPATNARDGAVTVFTSVIGAQSDIDCDVLVLPGFPCPSFLARRMAESVVNLVPRARLVSIDWPGVGESDAPQDGIGGFTYGVESATDAVRKVARSFALGDGRPLWVVAHGYLGTGVGVAIARESNARGVVLMSPALGRHAHDLPGELRKLRNPFVGPLLTGNPAHMADKVFASATPYTIDEADMMVLRSPFMRSGGPGFAARAIALNIDWKESAEKAMANVLELNCPVRFVVAQGDRWLPNREAEGRVQDVAKIMTDGGNENVGVTSWEFAGHFIFDDQPEESAKLVAEFMTAAY